MFLSSARRALLIMPKERVFIEIDFTPVMTFVRDYRENALSMLRAMGEVHTEQQRRRFLLFAAGGGSWPALDRSTVRAKERQGWPRPEAILIRSGKMSEAIDYKIIRRGQSYVVGFVDETLQYPKNYFKGTVIQLALIHNDGEGRVPERRVVALPTHSEKKDLMDVSARFFSEMTRKANQKKVVMR